jgi:uncharacterized cupin superfamily protein
MSGFTLVNLNEVENSAGDRSADVDARFARKHIGSEHLGVSYFRYRPGYRSKAGHSHREQEEAYVVIGGSGRARLDQEIVELKHFDLLRVAAETVRAFEAGEDGLELIAIGSDRPEGGDGILAPDWWTD